MICVILKQKEREISNVCNWIYDSSYRDQVYIPLHNDTTVTQYVRHGERIAQFTILPVPVVNMIEVDELNMADDRGGGFGHTGTL